MLTSSSPRGTELIRQRMGITIRPLNMRDFEGEVERIKELLAAQEEEARQRAAATPPATVPQNPPGQDGPAAGGEEEEE